MCTGIRNLMNVDIDTWICPECRCAIKKGGDNSFTPVGVKQDPNVTLRKNVSTNSTSNYVDNIALISEIHDLRSEMSTLKELLTKALTLIGGHEDKLERYALQVKQLNNKLEKYEKQDIQTTPLRAVHEPRANSLSNTDVAIKPTAVKQQPKQQVIGNSQSYHQASRHLHTDHIIPPTQELDQSVIAVVRQEHNTQNDGEWIEVKKRNYRQRQKPLHGTADPLSINLKAMEIRKHFHLWNMASDIDEVRQYLSQLYPTAGCSVEELSARGDYKSYKIGVPAEFYDRIYSADIWPLNARIKPWINYRKSTSKINELQNLSPGQPFRKPTSTKPQ
ncbi:unnamed protein product [Spodoptera littoralis]|uniref:Uncharacterized protein n=1 Tax=Spodoptera littoralis TaxID=7109 RepID=A0A9P0N0C7_SPOLI|nr:unnamed protein product [Spodoptera littoralis]CAH1637878.1 unnamed protein product [Spodoptera littoralis]